MVRLLEAAVDNREDREPAALADDVDQADLEAVHGLCPVHQTELQTGVLVGFIVPAVLQAGELAALVNIQPAQLNPRSALSREIDCAVLDALHPARGMVGDTEIQTGDVGILAVDDVPAQPGDGLV